jgi:hypothetical protein
VLSEDDRVCEEGVRENMNSSSSCCALILLAVIFSISGCKQGSTTSKMDANDTVDLNLIALYAEAVNETADARAKPSNGRNCEPYVVDARTVSTRGGLLPAQGRAYIVLMRSDKTLEYAGTCGGTPVECAQQVARRMDEFCPRAP